MKQKPPRLIDLSRTIEEGMPLFSPTAPQPRITTWLSHQQASASGRYEGCTCEITRVEFMTSAGTYLDSPFHFHPGRRTIDLLPLEMLVLEGVKVDATGLEPRQPLGPDLLEGIEVKDRAVLFETGWSVHWGRPEYLASPFLTEETARFLRDRGARLAGVDLMLIDDPADPRRPVHVTLLGADVLIVENLTNLAALPPEGFVFHAAPVKVKGAAAFPVRAYAVVG